MVNLEDIVEPLPFVEFESIDGSDGVASMSSNVDDELAAIRAKRMSEIQGQLEEQAAAQADAEIKQQVAQAEELELDNAMKTILKVILNSSSIHSYPCFTFLAMF